MPYGDYFDERKDNYSFKSNFKQEGKESQEMLQSAAKVIPMQDEKGKSNQRGEILKIDYLARSHGLQSSLAGYDLIFWGEKLFPFEMRNLRRFAHKTRPRTGRSSSF